MQCIVQYFSPYNSLHSLSSIRHRNFNNSLKHSVSIYLRSSICSHYPISYFMNCEEGFTVNINWIMLLQTVSTWQELLNIRIRRRSPPSHGKHHDIQNKSKKISCFDFVLFLWSWDYKVMDKDDWRGAYINFFLPFL